MDATTLNLAELVQHHRAYDNDHGERDQLHKLFPHLEGWHAAAEYLQQIHTDAYWEARGGFDPMSLDDPGLDPGYVALTKVYDEALRKIESGEMKPSGSDE